MQQRAAEKKNVNSKTMRQGVAKNKFVNNETARGEHKRVNLQTMQQRVAKM